MVGERVLIEGWPSLLSAAMAARYLSLDEATFQSFTARNGIQPVEPFPGELRWRRTDLDMHVKRLPSVSAPQVTRDRAAIELGQDTIAKLTQAVVRCLNEKPANDPRALLSIKDAAGLLGLGRSTIYKMIEEERLQPRRIGSRTLIPRSQVDALLAGQQTSQES